MKELDDVQISAILEAKLKSDYPDEIVELGENWALIADIFYKAGYDAANAASSRGKNV